MVLRPGKNNFGDDGGGRRLAGTPADSGLHLADAFAQELLLRTEHVPAAVAWHDGPEWSDRGDGSTLAAVLDWEAVHPVCAKLIKLPEWLHNLLTVAP